MTSPPVAIVATGGFFCLCCAGSRLRRPHQAQTLLTFAARSHFGSHDIGNSAVPFWSEHALFQKLLRAFSDLRRQRRCVASQLCGRRDRASGVTRAIHLKFTQILDRALMTHRSRLDVFELIREMCMT